MPQNTKNYLDYTGLALFWREAQKVINTSISDAVADVDVDISNLITAINVTYNGALEPIISYTHKPDDPTGEQGLLATINMSAYAKKSDISAALTFKGNATGAQLAAATLDGAGDTLQVANGDVYSCTEDSGTFVEGREYAAVVKEAVPATDPVTYTLSWVELGGSVDVSDFVTISEFNAAIAECASAANLTALTERVSALETSVSNIAEIETEDILALFTEPEPDPETQTEP